MLLGAGAGFIIISAILVLILCKSDMMKVEQTAQGHWLVTAKDQLDTKPIRVGIFNTSAWNQEAAEEWREGLEEINRRLQKLEKGYHLELEMSAGRLESPQDLYTLEKVPDMVLAYGVLISEEEMESVFLELTPYLQSSSLESIYAKRSDAYWQSKVEAGGIYNLSNNSVGSCQAVNVDITKCREIGYEVPKIAEPMELSAWEAEFEKIYQANERKPFIYFGKGWIEGTGQIKGILLDCRSQGQIRIYSGLDFDGEEAVFPYNEALKEKLALYQKWAEKGYLTEDWLESLIQFESAVQKEPYEYVEKVLTGARPEDAEEHIMAVFPIKGEPFIRIIDRSYFRAKVCGVAKEGENPETAMEIFSLMNTDPVIKKEAQKLNLISDVVYDDQEQVPDQILNIGLKELSLDLNPVSQEVAAINRIINKYEPRFKLAYYDQWLVYYDQMIKELYENGAQEIVDEVNQQLVDK